MRSMPRGEGFLARDRLFGPTTFRQGKRLSRTVIAARSVSLVGVFALVASCGGGIPSSIDAGTGIDAGAGVDSGIEAGAGVPGLGDVCIPEAVPSGGFSPAEVYVELASSACPTRICMVYHLGADPACTPDCAECGSAGASCPGCMPDSLGSYACLVLGHPEHTASSERLFCSCRCGAGGNPSLPLCECSAGFRCVPDGDPGGGYCVPDAVALHSAPAICERDDECVVFGGLCDLATHHCL